MARLYGHQIFRSQHQCQSLNRFVTTRFNTRSLRIHPMPEPSSKRTDISLQKNRFHAYLCCRIGCMAARMITPYP